MSMLSISGHALCRANFIAKTCPATRADGRMQVCVWGGVGASGPDRQIMHECRTDTFASTAQSYLDPG
jgi:hypothetical protein